VKFTRLGIRRSAFAILCFTVPSRRPLARLLTIALTITGAWFAAGVYFATQHHVIAVTRGRVDVEGERLIAMVAATMVWALFTPVVVFIAERFPLRRPRLALNVVSMILFALGIAAVRAPIDIVLPFVLEGYGPTRDAGLRYAVALWHTHFLFALVLIGITNFLRLQREAAERRRAEVESRAALAQARLRRLRADLNPHFLFNALNAVAAQVHTAPAAAERTLDTLAELLRRSLELEDVPEVPLVDEIEFVERYLDVQKTRFGDRLTTRVEIASPDLLTSAFPPLLIQPLVENAIVHSVARRRDGGRVEVRVARDGRWLIVQVRDDGPGCDPVQIFRNGGVGVSNAKTRLEQLYGSNQSLTYRRVDGTFVAEVRMPLRYLETRLAS
jgi:two-component system LytT family sensor kinase